MSIVSIQMIIDLNRIIKEQELPYQVHLRDACGKQSMWLEALNENIEETQKEKVYDEISQYFDSEKMKLEYSEDKKTFWIARG